MNREMLCSEVSPLPALPAARARGSFACPDTGKRVKIEAKDEAEAVNINEYVTYC